MSVPACERATSELVAYLDGELPAEARRPVAEHLAACLPCRHELERLRSLRTWVADLPKVAPGPGFADDFARRLAAEPRPAAVRRAGPRGHPWILPALAAAAVLALALRAFTTAPRSPASPPDAPAGRVATAPTAAVAKSAPAVVAVVPTARAAPAQLADVERLPPEDPPAELLEHPELFLRLPVVRRLETLEYLGALREREAGGDGGAG